MLCLQLLSPKICGWIFVVQWFNRRTPNKKQKTRQSASKLQRSVTRKKHHKFIFLSVHIFRGQQPLSFRLADSCFLSKFTVFWHGSDHEIIFQKTTIPFTLNNSNFSPQKAAGIKSHTVFFWCCHGAKYSKNSSAKNTLLGNSAIIFTWLEGVLGKCKCIKKM